MNVRWGGIANLRNIYFIINIGLPNSNTGFSKNKLSASGKNAKPPKNDFGVPLGV